MRSLTLALACFLLAFSAPASQRHVEAVSEALIKLPAFTQEPVPEPPERRADRLKRGLAPHLWGATKHRPAGVDRLLWAGMLLELGRAESNYALYIWSDRCETGPYKCDNGRSKGPFQCQKRACPKLWTLDGGSPEWIEYAVNAASWNLASAWRRCRDQRSDPIAGAYAGYKGRCDWKGADARARRARAYASSLGAR